MDVTSVEVSHIDLIVMNPPFSKDVDHILHAWEIAPSECKTISLCNSSKVDITYTAKRKKLADIVLMNGSVQPFGDCFSNAERTSNINIDCIYLQKPDQYEEELGG